MALPELTLPAGTPAFSADHTIELVPLYADIPMATGHSRRRRVYTTVPRSVNVKLDVTNAQMLAIHDWFEGPLKAGALEFSAQVANQGPGLLWWRARFVEPYTADAHESGLSFFVNGKLLLTGTGSVVGPYVSAVGAVTSIALAGSATLTAPINLSADTLVGLLSTNPISAATVIALTSIQDGASPSAVAFDLRWIWMRLNYAPGRSNDVADTSVADQRSWMGL